MYTPITLLQRGKTPTSALHIYIYIYIWKGRKREEKEEEGNEYSILTVFFWTLTRYSWCVYIYIYIYIYIYMCVCVCVCVCSSSEACSVRVIVNRNGRDQLSPKFERSCLCFISCQYPRIGHEYISSCYWYLSVDQIELFNFGKTTSQREL